MYIRLFRLWGTKCYKLTHLITLFRYLVYSYTHAHTGYQRKISSLFPHTHRIPEEDQLSFLVHNAAVGNPEKFGEISEEHFEYALRVNVTAPLMLSQKFLPRLKKTSCDTQGSEGRIVHLGIMFYDVSFSFWLH